MKQTRKRSRKPKTHKKSKAPKAKRVRSKGKTKKGKRSKKMNPYMAALQKARKSGAESFTYGGNTYKKKKNRKTGGLTLYSK